MVAYPRYFEYDGVLIRIMLENDELVAYDQSGKPFDGIGRALQDGQELTQKEYEQKLRIAQPQPDHAANTANKPKTWNDLIKEI